MSGDRALIVHDASAAARREAVLAWLVASEAPVTLLVSARAAGESLVAEAARRVGRPLSIEVATPLAMALSRTEARRRREGWALSLGVRHVASVAAWLRATAVTSPTSLGRFARVLETRGLPRALATTFDALAMAGVVVDELAPLDAELAQLYGAFRSSARNERRLDRAAVFELAIEELAHESSRLAALDITPTGLEATWLTRWAERAPSLFAVHPRDPARPRFGAVPDASSVASSVASAATIASGPAALSLSIFSADAPPLADAHRHLALHRVDDVRAECELVAREARDHLARGHTARSIAVVLVDPRRHRHVLADTFARAGLPHRFEGGLRRPDPSGRAFLALLACASEGLSARAFAEYLAFAVAPRPSRASLGGDRTFALTDDEQGEVDDLPDEEDSVDDRPDDEQDESSTSDPSARRRDELVVPRVWERLLVDAAVRHGGPARWRARLLGLDRELAVRLSSIDDPVERDALALEREELRTLAAFALPIIEELAILPTEAPLGVLVESLAALAPRVLEAPSRVLGVLASLRGRARAAARPDDERLSLRALRAVLEPELAALTHRPPDDTDAIEIVSPTELRGRSFALVLLPGLSEESARRVYEDPCLSDARKRALLAAHPSRDVPTSARRIEEQRALPLLALSAATERLVATSARRDEGGRAMAPSHHAHALHRLLHGTPLEDDHRPSPAALVDGATARRDRVLAVLESLASGADVRGALVATLERRPHLAEAVRTRYVREGEARRDARQGPPLDGLVLRTAEQKREVPSLLERDRPSERAYSATALETFATCPFKFFLRAIQRVPGPPSEESATRLEPRTRGTIVHEIQRRFLERATAEGLFVDQATVLASAPLLHRELERAIEECAAEARGAFAPSLPRAFDEELAALADDVRGWLETTYLRPAPSDPYFAPVHFELAFGDRHRSPGLATPPAIGEHHLRAADPESVREPVALVGENGEVLFRLRGSIDLVERAPRAEGSSLVRATDWKTGRAPGDARRGEVVRGGESLQPVLYAAVLAALFPGEVVAGGRLHYVTSRERWKSLLVPYDERAKTAVATLSSAIDSSLASGFFPAMPRPGACRFCDFRGACGPGSVRRSDPGRGLDDARLAPLRTVRRLP